MTSPTGPQAIAEVWQNLSKQRHATFIAMLSILFLIKGMGVFGILPYQNAIIIIWANVIPSILVFLLCIHSFSNISLKEFISRIGFPGRNLLLYSFVFLIVFSGVCHFILSISPLYSLLLVIEVLRVALPEELLFRALFLGYFLSSIPKHSSLIHRHSAFLLSSLVFAFYHDLQIYALLGSLSPIDTLVGTFLSDTIIKIFIGYLLAYLYDTTKNISYPIAVHAFLNVFLYG